MLILIFSYSSWLYICSHCRFIKAYRVHTVTSHPKVIPGKIFSRPRQRLWIKIADFPFRRPITCATPYLGRCSSSYGYDRTSHALPPTLCQTDCTILETDFLFLLEFFQIAFFTICWNKDDVIQAVPRHMGPFVPFMHRLIPWHPLGGNAVVWAFLFTALSQPRYGWTLSSHTAGSSGLTDLELFLVFLKYINKL